MVGMRIGRNWAVSFIIAASMTVLLCPSAAADPSIMGASATHTPILIDDDADFTASNGVVGGSGSSADPYVIEGWNIVVDAGPAISMVNTRAHFVVRDCTLSGSPSPPEYTYGVTFENVWNGALSNLDFQSLTGDMETVYVRSITIDSCHFTSSLGVSIGVGSSQLVISNNTFDGCGLYVGQAGGDIMIESNNFEETLWIWESTGLTISSNTISGRSGLELYYTNHTAISDNVFVNCTLEIGGSELEHFNTHVIDDSNMVNSAPVVYVKDKTGLNINAQTLGQLILANVSDSVVSNFEGPEFPDPYQIAESGWDIILGFCGNVTVADSRFANRDRGVEATHSIGVNVRDCVFENVDIGICAGLCVGCTIEENRFLEIPSQGINTGSSDTLLIRNNTFSGDEEALYVYNTWNVTIHGNTFSTIGTAIRFEDARNVLVYHNNFMSGELNFWGSYNWNISFDKGLPEGGNYWAGQDTDDADGDGLGDVPIVLYENSATNTLYADMHPLVEPYGSEDSYIWLLVGACLVGVVVVLGGWLALRSRSKKEKV